MSGIIKYKVRTSVLDMTAEMWSKYYAVYGVNDFYGPASEFLIDIGLPGGLSARYNDGEKVFFRIIYELYREMEDVSGIAP